MPTWTTADLLTAAKLRAMAPANDLVITDANYLSLATDELYTILSPIISSARGTYYETVYDVTFTPGTLEYSFPDRALAGKLLSVLALDSGGNERTVQIIEYAEAAARRLAPSGSTGIPYLAYVRNHKLIFVEEPANIAAVRMTFYIRPGTLITTADARQITAVTPTSITLSSALTGLSTGTQFDIISNKPIFPYRGYDLTGTVAGATITMTPPSGTAVGDWVALAGYSPIPQIPYELHPVLAQRTAARILGILGDANGMQLLMASAGEQMAQILTLVAPRVADNPSYIVSTVWPHSRRWRY